MTNSYSAARFNTFSLTDNEGNSYLFVRSFNQKRKGWYNIAKREIVAKDKCIPRGYAGIIPDAVWFSDEEVAELLAEAEEHQERLKRAESALREYLEFKEAWLRKPAKQGGKLRLAKKEVVQ